MGFNLSQIINDFVNVKNMGTVNGAVVLHDNTSTVAVGSTLVLNGESHVLLKASGHYFNFEVHLSKDGTTWTSVPVQSVYNGQSQNLIMSGGDYVVNTTGWKYLICPVKYSCLSLTVSAIAVYGIVEPLETTEKPTFSRPSPIRPDWSETSNLYLGTVHDVHSDGATDTVYGFSGNSVRKSTDWGATFVSIKNFSGTTPPTVNFVKKLDNDTLLVGLTNNVTGLAEMWLSDNSEANFTKVYTGTVVGVTWSVWFGQSFFDNICLVGEYGNYNSAINVYASFDYGVTWSKIFTAVASVEPGIHIHDVAYDPYDGIIWVTTGDGIKSHNVYWTKDRGVTWKSVYNIGTAPSQFTQILPLPNCVLFISDSSQHMGVFRWDRPREGIDTKIVRLVPAYMFDANYKAESPIGVKGAVTYGDNAAAYFGWNEHYAVAKYRCPVIGTHNGYDFFILWESKEVPLLTSSFVGVFGVAISKNGNIAITTRTHEGTNRGHLIKLSEPTWVSDY